MRPGADQQAAIRWALGFVRPQGRALVQVLSLSIVATGLALVQPYLTKLLIDDGLIERDMAVVSWLCGILVAAAVLSAAAGGLNRWLYTALSGRILFAMREQVYRQLTSLSPDFHAARGTGDIMTRLDGDIAEIQRFSTDSLLAVVNGVLALVGSLAVMLWMSPLLTLIAFVLLPLQVAYLRTMRPRIQRLTRAARERAGDITGFLVETLGAMKFVQAVGAGEREARRLAGLHSDYLSDQLRLQITNYLAGAAPGVLMTLAIALVFVTGGYLVADERITIGTLIAFSVYMGRAAGPIRTFLGLYVASQRARVSLSRVMELACQRPVICSPAHPASLPDKAKGAIRFECVTFFRPGRDRAVLDHASLEIPGAAKVAIVGRSGVGKSTMTDLLHRHYDPDVGRILLDGIDLKTLDIGALRRAIAVVAQDTVLFRSTIADNIRYARPGATRAEIIDAAARARIDGFIRTLPDGYDTSAGERGAQLSGGQRQRLAMARAILQDPLVLVLDEATTGIDRETEAQLIDQIDRLFADRTRILIGHRETLIADTDQVLELYDGKLIAWPDRAPAALGAAGE